MNERELLKACQEYLLEHDHEFPDENPACVGCKLQERIATVLSAPAKQEQAEVGESVKRLRASGDECARYAGEALSHSNQQFYARLAILLREAAALLTQLTETKEKDSVLADAARSALNVLVGVSDQTLATDIETAIRQLTVALAAQSGKEGK